MKEVSGCPGLLTRGAKRLPAKKKEAALCDGRSLKRLCSVWYFAVVYRGTLWFIFVISGLEFLGPDLHH